MQKKDRSPFTFASVFSLLYKYHHFTTTRVTDVPQRTTYTPLTGTNNKERPFTDADTTI